jgi:predicted DNA-binding protein YlxM (UPF0122 family)
VRRGEATVQRMLRMSMLLDAYGSLLTEKQRKFMKLHYEQDLSFGEIAIDFSVSRQAIHDSVRHAERALENLEKKLKLVSQQQGLDHCKKIAERLINLKQRVQQQGIIYNSEWIQRGLSDIVESLVSPAGEGQGEEAPSLDSE